MPDSARNKLRQAQWAMACGLSGLLTVAGSPVMAAQKLGSDGVDSVVSKFLGDAAVAWATVPDQVPVTRPVSLEELMTCGDSPPLLLQQRVEVAREFRVVAVDDRVFAASSSERLDGGVVDRRVALGGEHLHAFEKAEMPPMIAERLQQMLALAGLGYCSADLLEDREGALHLIDLNTTGAWWWIDDLYDGAVTAALTDALIHRAAAG